MNTLYNKLLDDWAREYRKTLSLDILHLINQANSDLYFGPQACYDADVDADSDADLTIRYPGFESASNLIRRALESVPAQLFLDVETGTWFETEPTEEVCISCDGSGIYDDDDSPPCGACDGKGYVEPNYSDYYSVDKKDLIRVLVGKELLPYVI